MSNQREFYRVNYPPKVCPMLIYEGEHYAIHNASEHGICTCEPIPGLEVGTKVVALLQLYESEPFPIEGQVARVLDNAVAINFDRRGISYKKIIKEQQRLIQEFSSSFEE